MRRLGAKSSRMRDCEEGESLCPQSFFLLNKIIKHQVIDSNANFGKAFQATLEAKKCFRGTGRSEAKVRRLGAKSSRMRDCEEGEFTTLPTNTWIRR
ncbi:hypothetical protein [Leptospira alexanderi]|uniref:hypothetical protein n=1 Tax=Leptospira alexanderi TaxID=100053 RepID=UPI001FCF8BCD|nr:hypothetical protein [Leptospira alexanderi]